MSNFGVPVYGWHQGICPECNRRLSVAPSGLMRKHPERKPERCAGSGKPPKRGSLS